MVVLYAISQGLNVISTALMGVCANALGGVHLHELFKLPTSNNAARTPYIGAKMTLAKIQHNALLLYILRTLDVLFLDESGQVSAEFLAMIDIILRKCRNNSQIPFGGVHLNGTMDPSQLQPINMLPFLTSSLIITCFVMIELKFSVRAYGDVDFQRLQKITRFDPYELRESQELKDEFFEVAGRILTYVSTWDDKRINPNMMRSFSRKIPAQETLIAYRESIKRQLTSEGTIFCIASSRDTHKMRGSSVDYGPAGEQSIKALNRELKEPSELVFF